MPTLSPRLLLALLIVYLVWGSTYLAIRVAVGEWPPFLMAGTRFLAAGLALALAGLAARAPRPTLRQLAGAGLVGLFLLLGGNGLVVWAEQWLDSGLTALLVATVPLFSLSLESLLPDGRPPGPRQRAGVLVGFLGMGLLCAPSLGRPEAGTFWPVLALLGASFLWACGMALGRRLPVPGAGTFNSAANQLAAAVAFLLLSCGLGETRGFEWGSLSASAWGAWAYLVAFGSIVGFSAFAWLNRKAPPALTATYAYVNPVVAVILGALVLGERLTPATLAGAAVVVGAVALVLSPGRPAPSEEPA